MSVFRKKQKPIEISISFTLEELENMIDKIQRNVSGFRDHSDYDSIEDGTEEIFVKLEISKNKNHSDSYNVSKQVTFVKFGYTGTYYSED